MKYTRNKDVGFYDANFDANCGSYALKIKEWYEPLSIFEEDIEDVFYELVEIEEYTVPQARDILFNMCVEQILLDFPDLIRVYSKNTFVGDNEELIAFRMCARKSEYGENIIDFHFKVLRNGKWSEKTGHGEVKACECQPVAPWVVNEKLIYEGNIAYFIKIV